MYEVPIEEEVIDDQGQVISKSTIVHHTRASLKQDIIRAMVNIGEAAGMTAGRIIAREGVILWLIGGLGAYRKWKVGDPKVSRHTESHYASPAQAIGGLVILRRLCRRQEALGGSNPRGSGPLSPMTLPQ